MAPAAKIAAYKVCFERHRPRHRRLLHLRDPVRDRRRDRRRRRRHQLLDLRRHDTVVDAVEFAFLGAAAAGVFVAASAGNSGPDASTVAHNSPWLTTVAASTHVNFENTVVLGNGSKLQGCVDHR